MDISKEVYKRIAKSWTDDDALYAICKELGVEEVRDLKVAFLEMSREIGDSYIPKMEELFGEDYPRQVGILTGKLSKAGIITKGQFMNWKAKDMLKCHLTVRELSMLATLYDELSN